MCNRRGFGATNITTWKIVLENKKSDYCPYWLLVLVGSLPALDPTRLTTFWSLFMGLSLVQNICMNQFKEFCKCAQA